jgi:hypothetical protein
MCTSRRLGGGSLARNEAGERFDAGAAAASWATRSHRTFTAHHDLALRDVPRAAVWMLRENVMH